MEQPSADQILRDFRKVLLQRIIKLKPLRKYKLTDALDSRVWEISYLRRILMTRRARRGLLRRVY